MRKRPESLFTTRAVQVQAARLRRATARRGHWARLTTEKLAIERGRLAALAPFAVVPVTA